MAYAEEDYVLDFERHSRVRGEGSWCGGVGAWVEIAGYL